MKIIHIDETFHPLYGYQVNPLAKFQSRAGHDVYIVTVSSDMIYPVYKEFGDTGENLEQHDEQYEIESGVKIIRVPVHRYVSGRAIYKSTLFQVINDLDPDVIFAHLAESYATIRLLLRRKKYPMVLDSHMLAMASQNRFSRVYEIFYKTFISRIIRKHKLIVIRTQDDDYVISHLGVPAEQAPFVSFGSDTSIFKPDHAARKKFRRDLDISDDDFLVVYTGKLNESKGALLMAKTIREKMIGRNNKNAVFMIVGNAVDAYGQEVERLFSESENRLLRFPTQNYSDLAVFYQASDLSIFPRQCSLSFYDAQACGLPVLSEDNSVNIERCSHENGGTFKAGNGQDFREKILQFMDMDENDYETMRQNALALIVDHYNYEQLEKQYTQILVSEYNRFHIERKGPVR
jgi:glycosyltransferase involved in cell wall biosynthesis